MELVALYDFIDTNIGTKTGTDKIKGAQHNAVLKEVVASLIEITGTGFGGDIATADNPGAQSNPIYFLASEVGTYTFCAGLEVTALPAFIVWKQNSWRLNQIGVASEETTDNGLRGLARAGYPQPNNPQVGDWYVYLDSSELEWPSQTAIAKPGIVRLDSINPSNNWVLTPFGDEGGGGTPIEIDAVPTKDSTKAVSSGGVYKTIKQTFVVESITDHGVISSSEPFRITSIVAENDLNVSVKYADGTDYTLGDPLPAFDKLYFMGDALNKIFTVNGEIL